MKRIMFVLLLVAMGNAQEVRGPYDILRTGEHLDPFKVARCTEAFVEIVSDAGPGHIFVYHYFYAEDTLVCDSIDLADVPEGWYGETYGPVRWDNNWSLISYQSQPESQIDFRWNRTVLIASENGEIIAGMLDSGRTHPYWVDSLWSRSSQFELFPRTDGGFFLKRDHSFSERDSSGEFEVHSERLISSFHGNGVYPIEWAVDCGSLQNPPDGLSLVADSILLFSHYGWNYEYDVFGCFVSPAGAGFMATWENCLIYPYAYCMTPDGRFLYLTGYSPVFQLLELHADGSCDLVGEAYTPAQRAFAHPDYGFTLLTTGADGIRLGQIDLSGQLLRPSTIVYESEYYPSLLDYTIADNGDIYLLWREDGIQIKLLIIPWDAVLDAPEPSVPVVPRELALSAYPNPFNSSVTLHYDVPQAGEITLAVYDVKGRLVETLRDEFAQAGSHELMWSPRNAASGVYFLSIRNSVNRASQKILYLK